MNSNSCKFCYVYMEGVKNIQFGRLSLSTLFVYRMVAWHDTEDEDAKSQVHEKIDGNWRDLLRVFEHCKDA